jgi:hypothetical protein
MELRGANGNRQSPFIELTKEDIILLKEDIAEIDADENVFVFNDGFQTSYLDFTDKVVVMGDIYPDETSIHPRDLMSSRAVLAHEYYGHRANRNTPLRKGSWNDEFRASYMAAKNAPGLSDQDRKLLVLDAIERAKEFGVRIELNNYMRRVVYGTDYSTLETDNS